MTSIPLWAQIVLVLLGGGLAGAFSPIFTAQLGNLQKKNEDRLTIARSHIETVYLPINISLSHLAEKYQYYKSYKHSFEEAREGLKQISDFSIEPDSRDQKILLAVRQHSKNESEWLGKTRQDFILACGAYLELMSTIANQGNDMYLTIKLEERLRSFTTFIQAFMTTPTFQEDLSEMIVAQSEVGKSALESLYACSAGSPDFTHRFEKDIHNLKLFIKEVTLGR